MSPLPLAAAAPGRPRCSYGPFFCWLPLVTARSGQFPAAHVAASRSTGWWRAGRDTERPFPAAHVAARSAGTGRRRRSSPRSGHARPPTLQSVPGDQVDVLMPVRSGRSRPPTLQLRRQLLPGVDGQGLAAALRCRPRCRSFAPVLGSYPETLTAAAPGCPRCSHCSQTCSRRSRSLSQRPLPAAHIAASACSSAPSRRWRLAAAAPSRQPTLQLRRVDPDHERVRALAAAASGRPRCSTPLRNEIP